jgi:endonuclease/exonuclease/phosphatase (EEP) superfamily protein YafD
MKRARRVSLGCAGRSSRPRSSHTRPPSRDEGVVAGDFNEIGEGDLFQSLKAAGFESALGKAGETGETWSWPGLAKPLGAQLDHVTYSAAAFSLVSAKVLKGGNSDHVPIVITLRCGKP